MPQTYSIVKIVCTTQLTVSTASQSTPVIPASWSITFHSCGKGKYQCERGTNNQFRTLTINIFTQKSSVISSIRQPLSNSVILLLAPIGNRVISSIICIANVVRITTSQERRATRATYWVGHLVGRGEELEQKI